MTRVAAINKDMMLDKRLNNQTELRSQMRSRKVATARHCRRAPACAYPAIRDGWPAGARKQSEAACRRKTRTPPGSESGGGVSGTLMCGRSGEGVLPFACHSPPGVDGLPPRLCDLHSNDLDRASAGNHPLRHRESRPAMQRSTSRGTGKPCASISALSVAAVVTERVANGIRHERARSHAATRRAPAWSNRSSDWPGSF